MAVGRNSYSIGPLTSPWKMPKCFQELLVQLSFLSLLLLLSTPLVSLKKVDVSIPPLLEEGPSKGELLFHISRDPQQKAENLTIPCKADALPLPSYSWFKNGLHFTPEVEGAVMLEGVGTIVFTNPEQKDEGDYQCVATNSAGSVFSDIAKVRRGTIISFPKGEPRVVTAKIGQPLALKCDNPGGYPKPTLHWVLQESDGSLRSVSSSRATMDDEGTLWFGTVTKADASNEALYACAASSATRTEYRMGNWIYLNVTSEATAGEPPAVGPFLQKVNEGEQNALEGDAVRFYCIYGGNPIPNIRWWRTDRRSIPLDRITDFGKALEIPDVRAFDAGEYKCQAVSDAGESEVHSFTLEIEAAPSFYEEPGTINQPIGESATFRCVAKGTPIPLITWSINGEPLEGSHDETLHFPSLKMSDKGVIACNASNVHGYAYATGFLNVLSLPPVFTVQPENTSGFPGDSMMVPCTGYGAPDPQVIWSKILDEGTEEEITEENYLYEVSNTGLLIKALSDRTSGMYKCTVVNKYGSISEVVRVQVKKSTSVSVGVSSPSAKAGDTLVLKCDVTVEEGSQVEVTWLKNDKPLVIDQERIIEKESTDKFRGPFDRQLIIKDSLGTDSGVYSCHSKTEDDDAEDYVVLTVEHVPEPPHVIELECSRREAYLKWGIKGPQTSPLLGFIVEVQTELHNGKWEEVENEIRPSEKSIRTVALIDLNPGLTYKFRVIAVNRAGSSLPSFPSGPCVAPGATPDYNPRDVTTKVVDPSCIKVLWKAIKPREHNGPEFRYVISWREVNDDVIDDDMTIVELEDEQDWLDIVIEDWEQTEMELEGLREKTRYKIRVMAMNAYGVAPGVEDVWSSTDPDAPLLSPTFLRVRRITPMTAILFWIPVPASSILGDATGHEVELRRTGSGTGESTGGSTDLVSTDTSNSVKLTGLSPFMTYEARVRVRSAKAPGPFSRRIKFMTAEGVSSSVRNLKALTVSSDAIIVTWEPPLYPRGIVHDYLLHYWPLRRSQGDKLEIISSPGEESAKISGLRTNTVYKISVAARNRRGKGEGRESFVQARTHSTVFSQPAIPSFGWTIIDAPTNEDDAEKIDEDDTKDDDRLAILFDKDGDGDIDLDDVQDTDGDGDIDDRDVDVADINNDGVIDRKDVIAADRDGDGDVDQADIGDEDGDGDFDANDVLKADEDGDGDIDAGDDDEENVILQDVDGDGDIDEDDSVDVDGDGDIDAVDLKILDIDNDGDIDEDDLKAGDRDGDGDVDAADVLDLDEDGKIDEDDFLVKDVDGDGDIDRRDYLLRRTFVADTDGDGDIDENDVIDVDHDGDIDSDDFNITDINNDGKIDENDVKAADRDGDGDVDTNDIGDEDGDGDIDGADVIIADEDGDGDIDSKDNNEEGVIFEDRDKDGDLDIDDVGDIDGDGDVDSDDISILDVNDDGVLDEKDLAIIDKDGDGDVDQADVADFDGDGRIDEDDLEVVDRDGDGDIDAKDIEHQTTYLKDTDGDGDIDENDVLDIDRDGDVDADDIRAADLDDDGDVDADDLRAYDRDGDGDIDINDAKDVDGDGILDEDDFDVTDRDGDGDIDALDYQNRRIFLADTDNDGDIDGDDVLDTDGDGDIDTRDFDIADINNDGKVDILDIRAGDVDGDGDIDIADIGDEDNDGDIDGNDVLAADEDGDGDIDADDDDGDSILLTDRNKDGLVDEKDVIDVNKDGIIDQSDLDALDIDNDGDVDEEDLRIGDLDGDGDIDAADVMDADGDGDVDGKDLLLSDRDGDGDIDESDRQNRFLLLGDADGDGDIDSEDILDTDRDGDIDQDDFSIADINNDGEITVDDIIAADRDGDGDVDNYDIEDVDNDGDIDGKDLLLSDKDGDGDIDLVDEGHGVSITVNWMPDLNSNPGSEFYVKYRPVGDKKWSRTGVEHKSLEQTLEGLEPNRAYEVQLVAKDGPFETPSEAVVIGPFSQAATHQPSEDLMMMSTNPLYMTWFIIAIIVAFLMFVIIICSVWVYHRRVTRVSELRAELYKDYVPPPVTKGKMGDVEAGVTEADGEEPTTTAQDQRQQMSALLRRQETVQSVDSFASHDDDFAEYGDETMGTTFNEDGSLIFKKD